LLLLVLQGVACQAGIPWTAAGRVELNKVARLTWWSIAVLAAIVVIALMLMP
jgi:hypothetical protein